MALAEPYSMRSLKKSWQRWGEKLMNKQLTNGPLRTGSMLMGVLLLSITLVVGCSATKPDNQADKPSQEQLKTVTTQKIEKSKIGDPIEQVADVVSSMQLDVIAKVGGDVKEIVKKRGEYVEMGEVIIRLDPVDVMLQHEKAAIAARGAELQLIKAREDLINSQQELRSAISNTEASLKDLEKTYSKQKNDYELGLVNKIQIEQMETQLNNMNLDLQINKDKLKTLETTNSLASMEQEVESSKLGLRESQRIASYLDIKAPSSGVITDMPIELGMTLNAGLRVAQIQRLDPIKIRAELTESGVSYVRGKTELQFNVSGSSEKWKASINYLADVMSTQSKSYPLELEVPNKDRKLKPGMKVQLQLTEDNDQIVVTIPTLAVVREEGETFAFILNEDTVEKRKITLGRLSETTQEVTFGVKEGELLVTSGQHQLKDKEKVQVAK
jgi:HlyD family secretion protein